MKKLIALLVGLAIVAFNALAAVNVNTATPEQLETLNGIGPAKAKAIVDYRTKNGPFKTVEELDNVPGIGQGILGKIKADVTVSGATTVKAAEPAKPAVKTEAVKPAAPAAPATKAEAAKPAPAAAAATPAVKPEPVKPVADAKADKKAKKEAKKAEKEAKKAEKDAAKPEAKSDAKK